MSVSDLFFFEGVDDSAEVLRAKIHRLIETDDVKTAAQVLPVTARI